MESVGEATFDGTGTFGSDNTATWGSAGLALTGQLVSDSYIVNFINRDVSPTYTISATDGTSSVMLNTVGAAIDVSNGIIRMANSSIVITDQMLLELWELGTDESNLTITRRSGIGIVKLDTNFLTTENITAQKGTFNKVNIFEGTGQSSIGQTLLQIENTVATKITGPEEPFVKFQAHFDKGTTRQVLVFRGVLEDPDSSGSGGYFVVDGQWEDKDVTSTALQRFRGVDMVMKQTGTLPVGADKIYNNFRAITATPSGSAGDMDIVITGFEATTTSQIVAGHADHDIEWTGFRASPPEVLMVDGVAEVIVLESVDCASPVS